VCVARCRLFICSGSLCVCVYVCVCLCVCVCVCIIIWPRRAAEGGEEVERGTKAQEVERSTEPASLLPLPWRGLPHDSPYAVEHGVVCVCVCVCASECACARVCVSVCVSTPATKHPHPTPTPTSTPTPTPTPTPIPTLTPPQPHRIPAHAKADGNLTEDKNADWLAYQEPH
jgi:hypothetical protein